MRPGARVKLKACGTVILRSGPRGETIKRVKFSPAQLDRIERSAPTGGVIRTADGEYLITKGEKSYDLT